MEHTMIESRDLQSGKRIATSLKVALVLAVLSMVALTVERPRLSAATAKHTARGESIYMSAVGSPADFNGTASENANDVRDKASIDGPDTAFPWPLLAP
jgi:hypothetical protein